MILYFNHFFNLLTWYYLSDVSELHKTSLFFVFELVVFNENLDFFD